jgi:hypothetical protein
LETGGVHSLAGGFGTGQSLDPAGSQRRPASLNEEKTMADINIERKTGLPVWIWLVPALLLVGLALFWLLSDRGTDDVALVEPASEATPQIAESRPDPAAAGATAPAVQQYLDTCAAREPSQMAMDHQYTSNCIRMLVQATRGAAPAGRADMVRSDLTAAEEAADRLADSATQAQDHSRHVRTAFTSVANAIYALQSPPSTPGTQRGTLMQRAEAVRADGLLLEQRTEVQSFFAQAGDALRNMTGNAAAAGSAR